MSDRNGSSGSASRSGRAALALALGAAYLARSIPGATVESLRAGLWLTDQALGTLASAFAGPFALALPVGAWLARDRRRRLPVLAAGLAASAAATALATAWARGFWPLVAARCVAGAGAGVGAGATAGLLVGLDRVRGRAVPGWGPAAAGVALGYLAGGLARGTHGWRGAFGFTAGALLLAAAACLAPADPGRRSPDPWPALRARDLALAARRILSDRARWLALLAAAIGAGAVSALVFWLPALLVRSRGVPRHIAGAELAAAALASALGGAALARAALRPRPGRGEARDGEPAAQEAAPGSAGGPGWVAAAGAGTAALALAAALYWTEPAITLPALMAGLVGVAAAVHGAMASVFRREPLDAPALGLSIMVVHGLGEVAGPFALGALADRVSFGRALYLLPGAFLASGLLWAAVAWARAARSRAVAPDSELASP